MQEQGERGHDESINKTGSVIRLCTLGYTHKKAFIDDKDSSFYQQPRHGCVGRLWVRMHDN
jgi:hypothetical protein